MKRILAAAIVTLAFPVQAAEIRVLASMEAFRFAVADARPGQVLELAPGSYLFDHDLDIRRPGAPGAPIVVRAARLGEVTLKFTTSEGFRVAAPNWSFENLVMEGVCAADGDCEHAFHLVGSASNTVIRNNRLLDFNSPIKVNGEDHAYPDSGLIEGNVLLNRRARHTGNPVTAIDIVAASRWVVRGNLVADFAKDGGNRTSYAGFMKGGGEGGVFENNVVACRRSVGPQAADEARVGLSFGGGGTEERYCRDGTCRFEHRGGVMRNNIVLNCSDVGIYLNKATGTRIIDEVLYQTAGIDIRFPTSSAEVRGAVFDGRIRERDGGRVSSHEIRAMTAADWARFKPPYGRCPTMVDCDPHDLAKR